MKTWKLFGVLVLTAVLGACQTVSNSEVWDSATIKDKEGNVTKRFIPVELFTGAQWDGTQKLSIMTPASKTILPREGGKMSLSTPEISEHTGKMVIVRDRHSRSAGGRVYQHFALNEKQDGLAMVYQDRAGNIRTTTITENKFPVGWWKEGETRRYNDSASTKITILELDMGSDHSLRFRWEADFSRGGDGEYIFTPGKGLVSAKVK